MSGRVDPVYKPSVVFAADAAVSSAVDISELDAVGLSLQIPTAWTAADIGFQGSNDDVSTAAEVTNWHTLYDDFGAPIIVQNIPTSGGGILLAPPKVGGILTSRWLRLVSRSASAFATPVNQAAERTLVLITLDESAPGSGALSESDAHVGSVGSQILTVTAEFARPSNTDAYLAKDVVGNTGSAAVITFEDVARVAGGTGYIIGARLMTDLKTCVAGFRLHLYSTPPTAIADNSPFLLLWANRASRLLTLDFPTMATEDATNSTAAAAEIADRPIPFVTAEDSRDLTAILETRDAFTPASAQNFFLELIVQVN